MPPATSRVRSDAEARQNEQCARCTGQHAPARRNAASDATHRYVRRTLRMRRTVERAETRPTAKPYAPNIHSVIAGTKLAMPKMTAKLGSPKKSTKV